MYYSEAIPGAIGESTRLVKAKQICAVIEKHCAGRDLRSMSVLDYGSSTGLMTSYFASRFKRAIGVDVDRPAIAQATARFTSQSAVFLAMNNEQTMFASGSFDVVVANQVYNFVQSQPDMFSELYRILKPGGVCFLGARNKYAVIEPQYRLPLLSMLPARLTASYLRAFRGTSTFIGSGYRSRAEIQRLASAFRIHDYTLDILRRPADFGFDELVPYARIANALPLEAIVSLVPNFVMILEKS
jgi:2-polyprenyl-3-methyl-5-hydroxy-6-metoxy-1,4-benzoquinol methylase